MTYNLLLTTCFTVLCSVFSSYSLAAQDIVSYVNPLTGTAASTTPTTFGMGSEQYANTIPAVGIPFGMTQWTPQTRPSEQKCRPPYTYSDPYFSGFRGTHWLSGSCTQDYGSFTVMPVSGSLRTAIADYQCPFTHDHETATPYFYSIDLQRYHLHAEVTATARCGIMRFTSQVGDSLYLLAIPNSDKNKGYIRIDRERNEITGYNPAHRLYQGAGQPAGFSGYFVIRFQQSFPSAGVFSGSELLSGDSLKNLKDVGGYAGFYMPAGSTLLVKVGTSFSSIEEARKNMDTEMTGWDFDAVKDQAKAVWEKELGKIQVSGGEEKDKRIFYTALYHTMQQPRLFSDADGTYPVFSQQYRLASLKKGNYYDDFSMWDIYRAEIPLYEILSPLLVNDWVRSLILKGQQGGWLPIFPCWNNYTVEMVGDHGIDFIASAYLKGIKDYDIEEAYRLMRRNAFEHPSEEEYLDGKGRRALQSYMQYGYVPMEDGVPHAFHKNEQVSRTLEYAYDDYSLAQVAQALHKKDDYEKLMQRSQNYRHVFDTSVGFVNGRYADGTWYTPFDPDKRISFITEGTPRQYSFYVPQDIPGLAQLMGGKDSLEAELDSLFMLNKYWHGNEPGQQIPFLYNYTRAPWKTQRQVRKILASEYTDGPGGLSGNDDAGQISAWYVFGAIGMYPVDPVSGQYALCSPLFDSIVLQLPGNKTFTIITRKQSSHSQYISAMKLNGKKHTGNFIRHTAIANGGRLEIQLADEPVK